MPRRQHIVRLTSTERADLEKRMSAGVSPARELTRVRILLKADVSQRARQLTDAQIAEAVEVSTRTVARVRADFAAGGVAAATTRRPPNREYAHKLDGAAEAALIELACSPPPPGHQGWSLRMLGAQLVFLHIVDSIAPNTVRATLKKTN